MPNDFFQFKQFRIDQGQCAMKVTTDGCLFGSVIEVPDKARKCLDVGAGTGLLSLMVAQRCRAAIEAIEIDKESAEQAGTNFSQSPWASRLTLYATPVQDFAADRTRSYDLIFCNPPFFSNHLPSGTTRDLAIHADTLLQADLMDAVDRLLLKSGQCWVMYPHFEFDQFRQGMVARGWYCYKAISVFNRPGAPIFRRIGAFSFEHKATVETNLYIRNQSGEYTKEFSELLKDYYL